MNLLEKKPCDLLEWVKLARSRKVDLPEDFSWYSLSSGIILKVESLIQDGIFEGLVAWLKVLNEIYDNVTSSNATSPEVETLQYELMRIRATLIMRAGVNKSEPILDERPLLTWFFHGLNVPLSTAIQKSDNWQDMKRENKVQLLRDKEGSADNTGQNVTIEDLRVLRKIKNKLSVLKPLYQHKLIENKELGDWISIMNRLP